MMKVLLTVLTVMLCIVIVFSTFGLSMRDSHGNLNFFSSFNIVGEKIDTLSDWTIKAYRSVKDFVTDVFPGLKGLINTLGDLVNSLNEKLRLFDGLKDMFDRAYNYIARVFNYLNMFIRFIADRGIEPLNIVYWRSLFTALNCVNDDNFYLSDKQLDFDKIYGFVDAFYYGKENEYSYMLEMAKTTNILDRPISESNCIVAGYYWSEFAEINIDNCSSWFTCPDLTIPDDYFPGLPQGLRIKYYLGSDVIPVYRSNMVYELDGYTLFLCGFEIVESDFNLYGLNGYFQNYNYSINLHFYWCSEDLSQQRMYEISLSEFLASERTIFDIGVPCYKIGTKAFSRDDERFYDFLNIWLYWATN